MDRRSAIAIIAASGLVGLDGAASAPPLADAVPDLTLRNAAFSAAIDPISGALLSIIHPDDPAGMSWIGGPDNAPWQPGGSQWGLGFADLGPDRLHRGRWGRAAITAGEGGAVIAMYRVGDLQVEVTRRLMNDALTEQYRFTNIGTAPIPMRGRGKASLAIYTPFNDHYTSTRDVLEHRGHAHVWTGGSSSWVAMFRMGGRGPHLGMVLTEGALDGYSIEDRDLVTLSNTRGTFLLHPVIGELAPGQSGTLGWTLFWHAGWDDFYGQAQRHSRQMVRIDASRWTAAPGQSVDLRVRGALGTPVLTVGEQPVALVRDGDAWRASIPYATPGERVATLRYGDGATTRAVLNAVPPIDDLIATRVRFITQNQQWASADDSWDGAYLVYDNELKTIVRTDRSSDRIAGRERVGMGLLVARWLRQGGGTEDPSVRASFDRFYAFVNAQLQRADGYVRDGPDRDKTRLYNWPWIMHLHVEVARLTRDPEAVQRLLRTIDSYYREGGIDHYPISLPIADSLALLKDVGLTREHDRIRGLFIRHGDTLVARGTDYPPFEVNFEQSIVAPAAITLLDLHRATGDARWLAAARKHVALLDLFEGRQPDHHLHGIAIRHWDGYWFGKARMWGDTFPHYWSTLNAVAWTLMARATGDASWADRAAVTLGGNLSLFRPDGSASAAYIYPDTVNGRPGKLADPYANDQDWALVHALQIRELQA